MRKVSCEELRIIDAGKFYGIENTNFNLGFNSDTKSFIFSINGLGYKHNYESSLITIKYGNEDGQKISIPLPSYFIKMLLHL